MLKVWVGSTGKEINPDNWFDNRFDDEKLLSDFSRRMLKEVAGCEVLDEMTLRSDILGVIPSSRMGSGCKAVLYMMYEEEKEKYGRIHIKWCGDNLIPFIREACEANDVEISCDRLFPYLSSRYGKFDGAIMVMDTGKICHTALEFYDEYIDVEEKKAKE